MSGFVYARNLQASSSRPLLSHEHHGVEVKADVRLDGLGCDLSSIFVRYLRAVSRGYVVFLVLGAKWSLNGQFSSYSIATVMFEIFVWVSATLLDVTSQHDESFTLKAKD